MVLMDAERAPVEADDTGVKLPFGFNASVGEYDVFAEFCSRLKYNNVK